jgi:Domain of unknown function (DUF1854)
MIEETIDRATLDEPARAPIETTDLRFLEPRQLRLSRHGAHLRLTLEHDCSYLQITLLPAFPLSDPRHYVSVRYGDNREIGIIADTQELDQESRRLVAEELERRYIVPIIQRVLTIKERFGSVDWTVATDRGVRRVTTRNLRENVVQPAPNRYLITDVDGNRYDVRDLAKLDSTSQAWLVRYI